MHIPKGRLKIICENNTNLSEIISAITDMARREETTKDEMLFFWVISLFRTGIFFKMNKTIRNELLFKSIHWTTLSLPKKNKVSSFDKLNNNLLRTDFFRLFNAACNAHNNLDQTEKDKYFFEDILTAFISLCRINTEIKNVLLKD